MECIVVNSCVVGGKLLTISAINFVDEINMDNNNKTNGVHYVCIRAGKVSDRHKEIFLALTGLDKQLFAEVFQQRYVNEQPMKFEDFAQALLEIQARKQSDPPHVW